ncbi:MAG TPA: hypothetical protein VEJ84_22815, partial [Acidimicrobiales bacterium]|nr:hypothetical protein [Acidimicrobiales bacterium]
WSARRQARRSSSSGTVSSSATYSPLAQQGWPTFFRDVADNNTEGAADAAFASHELNIRSVYSINDGSQYGGDVWTGFDQEAVALHMPVVAKTVPGTTICSAGHGNPDEYGPLSTEII